MDRQQRRRGGLFGGVARGAEGFDLRFGEGKHRGFRTRHQGRNHEQQDQDQDIGDGVKIDVFDKQQQRTTVRVGVQDDRIWLMKRNRGAARRVSDGMSGQRYANGVTDANIL